MASKNTFSIEGRDIHISRPEWNKLAFATYRKDYYEEITKYTWSANKGHINSRLGSLHKYIMSKWYPDIDINEMYRNGWIIEHMDNDGFNCRVSNLEFLQKRYNTAKGQTLDIDRERLMPKIALSMFKDFSTKCYQITIFFNTEVRNQADGRQINSLKLLYASNKSYRTVIADAEEILRTFELDNKIDLNKLHYNDYKIEYAIYVKLKPEEKDSAMIMRNGEWMLNLDSRYLICVNSIPYDEGWKPNVE